MISENLHLSTEKSFQHLLSVISSDRFRQKKGLGNEVPFFICPYPPQVSVEMEKGITQLCKNLGQKGVVVLNINLYDLVIELLQKRGIWEQILPLESTYSKSELLDLSNNFRSYAESLFLSNFNTICSGWWAMPTLHLALVCKFYIFWRGLMRN